MKKKKRINTNVFFGFLAFISVVVFLFSFLFEEAGKTIFLSISFLFGVMIPVFDFTENKEPYGRINPILYAVASLLTFIFVDNYQGLILLLVCALGVTLKETIGKTKINAEVIYEDVLERRYHVSREGKHITVVTKDIKLRDAVELYSGEIVPVDGIVLSGNATVTTSKMDNVTSTYQIKAGDSLAAGTTVLSGNLVIRAASDFESSTVSGILFYKEKVCKEVTAHEKWILNITSIATLVVAIGGIIAFTVFSIITKNPKVLANGAIWLCFICCVDSLRGLLHNVYVNAALRCSNNGIVAKNKRLIEKSMFIKNLLFRKQGVLTSRNPVVTKIVPVEGVSENELLNYATYAQYRANFPISYELRANYGKKVKDEDIARFMETEDNGAMVQLKSGIEIISGSAKVLADFGIISGIISEEAVLCVAVNNVFVGHIVFEYEIKDEIRQYVDSLKYAGAKNLSIITRDSERATKSIALKSGIKRYFSELDSKGIEDTVNKFGKNTVYVGYGKGDSYEFDKECVKLMYGGFLNDSKTTDGLILSDGLGSILKYFNILKDLRILGIENLVLWLLSLVALSSMAINASMSVVFGGLIVMICGLLINFNCYRIYKKI